MAVELKAALQQARACAAKTIQATDPVYAKNIVAGRCDDVWAVQAVLASLQAPCPGKVGEQREKAARIVDPWPFGIVANISHTERAKADRDKAFGKADQILAMLSASPGKPQDGEALPVELAGPWHPDETGTFNSAGWGFTVLVPDRFWDRPDNELPPEVTAIAEALERSVRKHLNATTLLADSQTSGGGR